MSFCVQSKSMPGSMFVDKETFAKFTAEAEHHLVDKAEVGMKLTAQTKVEKPSTETPLGTPSMDDIDDNTGIVAAGPDFRPVESGVTNKAGKETALGSPTLDFSDN